MQSNRFLARRAYMNNDFKKQEDVKDVMDAEKRRGTRRRPLDAEARRKVAALKEDFRRAIRAKDERAFAELLRKAGYPDDSPEFVRAWKMFREL